MEHATISYRLCSLLLDELICLLFLSAWVALASVPAPGTTTTPAPPVPADVTTLVRGAQ